MLTHVEQKILPYTAEQMFDLVAAVDQYNEFAPWCIASRINKWESETVFYADLIVGYKVFRERFSQDTDNGSCIIDFSVEFEFKNVALQTLANMFFNEVVKRMVGAFEARAEEIYGKPAPEMSMEIQHIDKSI